MKEPTLEELNARVWALREAMAYLLALHYRQDELAAVVADYRQGALEARTPAEGTERLPAATALMTAVAHVQDETADLFARALQLVEQRAPGGGQPEPQHHVLDAGS